MKFDNLPEIELPRKELIEKMRWPKDTAILEHSNSLPERLRYLNYLKEALKENPANEVLQRQVAEYDVYRQKDISRCSTCNELKSNCLCTEILGNLKEEAKEPEQIRDSLELPF